MTVIDANGLQGVVVEDAHVPSRLERHLLVRFENMQEVYVPVDVLVRRDDGHYSLNTSVEALHTAHMQGSGMTVTGGDDATQTRSDEASLVVPVIDETLTVQTRQRETGVVEIRKTIHERTETVDPLLYAEEVQVERVPINRLVDAPLPVRHEDDTTIIPLFEEVLVVEKRILLREEVHVKKARREVHKPQTVTLREERVDIVRKPGTGQDASAEGTQ